MLKDLLNGLIKSQVKYFQSDAFETKMATKIAATIPDVPTLNKKWLQRWQLI